MENTSAASAKKSFWQRPKFWLWLVLFGVVLTLIFQNVGPVQVKILFWSTPPIPMLLLILVAMALGSALTWWFSREFRQSRRKDYRGEA